MKQKFMKILLVSFCARQLLLSMGPGSGVWLVSRVKLHWRKQIFPLPVGSVSFGTSVRFTISLRGPTWQELMQALCLLAQSLCIRTCISLVSGRHCFFKVIRHLLPLKSFCLLFYVDPWALMGWALVMTSHLGLNVPGSLTLCILSSVCFCVNSHLL